MTVSLIFTAPWGNDSEWIFNSLLMACYTKLEQPPTIQQPFFSHKFLVSKNTISLICHLPFPIATRFGKALSKQWPALGVTDAYYRLYLFPSFNTGDTGKPLNYMMETIFTFAWCRQDCLPPTSSAHILFSV